MPWPDFSELSFGYAFLREFERLHASKGKFPAAPDFISQAAEATKGYDVAVLTNSTPVFFQFKRSFVLTTGNAKEVQNGDFVGTPLYRMHLREKDAYRQHTALQDLETSGEAVYYVTSQIETSDHLSDCYIKSTILSKATAGISPNEIVLPNTSSKHHITFEAGGEHFFIYSDRGERHNRTTPTWDKIAGRLLERRRGAESNRQALSIISERLASRSRRARALADRFADPVVKASVLAFLVLDAQLTFFKK